MAVNYTLPTQASLLPIDGVTLGYAKAHVKKPDRKDMLVISLAEGSRAAGVFTQNRFCAAPVPFQPQIPGRPQMHLANRAVVSSLEHLCIPVIPMPMM